MDIYAEKFTRLENEVLRLIFSNSGKSLNQREIALKLKVSPTAIAKSVKKLEKERLLDAKKSKSTNTFEISLNLKNPRIFFMKRVENLKMLYSSGLPEYLFNEFPGATIILFGSYSFGEDIFNSDIDIAIIGCKEKKLDLEAFERLFEKKITIQFYESFEKIHKNLKESILNGIILKGSVKL